MIKKYFPTFSHFILLAIGLFFIFSGLIKLNDSVGFSLKIEAYLRAFASDVHKVFLEFLPYTLPIAISICILEVVLGVALVGKFWTRLVLLALLGLTLFFTLLTLYTLWFKRVDSCGCLSEAIPLTPLQSFIKNILLLLILGWLIRKRELPSSTCTLLTQTGLLILATACSFFIGWYTLRNLPIIDFGYYKIGTYIPHLTQPQKPLRYQYWLEKDGITTASDTYPMDGAFRLIKTELLNPADRPLVTNFTIWNENKEITQEILQGIKLLCIVKHPRQLTNEAYSLLQAGMQQSSQRIDLLWLLPFHEAKESLPMEARSQVGWGSADLLQSMIRANIGFILLQNGAIMGKWSDKNLSKLREAFMQLK